MFDIKLNRIFKDDDIFFNETDVVILRLIYRSVTFELMACKGIVTPVITSNDRINKRLYAVFEDWQDYKMLLSTLM